MQKTCGLGMPVRSAVQLPDERVADEQRHQIYSCLLDLNRWTYAIGFVSGFVWTLMNADFADSEEKSAFPPALAGGARVSVHQRPILVADRVYVFLT
jgi:hypothetical protein